MRTITLFMLAFGMSLSLAGQPLRQDSVYIDRGIDDTQDFEAIERVYFVSYNEDGLATEIIKTRKQESGAFSFFERRLQTFNNGQLTNLRIQFWNADQEMWMDFSEQISSYNAEGNLEIFLLRKAPSSGMPLEDFRRKAYTYNAEGDITEIQLQQLNNNIWENRWRQSFTYNEMGDIETRQLQAWVGNNWRNLFQRQWSYDAENGSPEEVITQVWSAQNNEWENQYRRTLGYNNNGFWIGSLYQNWNTEQQMWENERREIHNLNNANKLDNFILQVWQDSVWINGSREITYASGMDFGTIIQRWDSLGGEWENWERFQTSINNQAVTSEVLNRQVWNAELTEWFNSSITQRLTYFWSDLTVDTDEALLAKLNCLIPNPYYPGAIIRCPELPLDENYSLELYDLSGRRLFAAAFRSDADVVLPSQLSPGMYILQLRQAEKLRMVEKLVIIR